MPFLVGSVMDDTPPAVWLYDDKLDVIDQLLTEWVHEKRELAGTVMFAMEHGANTEDIVEMSEEDHTDIRETIAFFIVSLLTQRPWLIDAYLEMVSESVVVVEMKAGHLPSVAEDPEEDEKEAE
jgi:hypothetical protein